MITLLMTCHTAGCENEGIAIPLAVLESGGACQCGPCGLPIDDVVETDRPMADLMVDFHAACDAKHGAP